jgi:hypothetical protein
MARRRYKQKAAAVLTIHRGSKMTKSGRRAIAQWLRRQARDLERLGKHYSGTMRARYLYVD